MKKKYLLKILILLAINYTLNLIVSLIHYTDLTNENAFLGAGVFYIVVSISSAIYAIVGLVELVNNHKNETRN